MLALLAVLPALAALPAQAAPAIISLRDVDTSYPYTGPAIPVGDPLDQTVMGNGKGYRRVREAPAVTPAPGIEVTNNINVISTAYFPGGFNVHFQTPFGIGCDPEIKWGETKDKLDQCAKGKTHTYDRTPSCSMLDPTQCSQFFHEVAVSGLQPGKEYFYQIPGGNGTTPSGILTFTTALEAGDDDEFSLAVVCDMGYTNARGTQEQLTKAIMDDVKFVWHGGDISYADQWYAPLLPCVLEGPKAWDICYNGSDTTLPTPDGGPDNDEYYIPLPAGEQPSQGGPFGGDISTVYESNWDMWQQWMNTITKHVPYLVAPGNHEAACAEFDGPNNELSAVLDDNATPGTHKANSSLNYYSCPPSQRNFTAYQHRFNMPGEETGGRTNFWYSFDYGLAHFITLNGETDFVLSPENSLDNKLAANNGTKLPQAKTWVTDSGPFGYINGDRKDNKAYEQYQWLVNDLKNIDRKKTPWVFAMSHRPMYSSEVSSYQNHVRDAWEDLFLEYEVDAYFAGHIHWYERMWPMGKNGTIVQDAVVNNHTYATQKGAVAHLVNGAAGEVESHSVLAKGESTLPLTAVLDQVHYGFSKITVHNATSALCQFVQGKDGSVGDYLYLTKN